MNFRRRTAGTGGSSLSVARAKACSLAALLVGCGDPLGIGQSTGGSVVARATELRIDPLRVSSGLPCVFPPEPGWGAFETRIFDLGVNPTVATLPEPVVVGRQPCFRSVVARADADRYYAVEVDGWDTLGVLRWRFACGTSGGEPTLAVEGRRVPVDGCVRVALVPPSADSDAAAPRPPALPDGGSLLSDAASPEAGPPGLGDAGLGDAGLGDAGLGDAGLGDAGPSDAGLGAAGPPNAAALQARGSAAIGDVPALRFSTVGSRACGKPSEYGAASPVACMDRSPL